MTMTKCDYVWLCETIFTFSLDSNVFTLFILFNKPRLCLPLFAFVYLCLPSLNLCLPLFTFVEMTIDAQFYACFIWINFWIRKNFKTNLGSKILGPKILGKKNITQANVARKIQLFPGPLSQTHWIKSFCKFWLYVLF